MLLAAVGGRRPGSGCRSSSTCRPGRPSRCSRAACSRWSRRRATRHRRRRRRGGAWRWRRAGRPRRRHAGGAGGRRDDDRDRRLGARRRRRPRHASTRCCGRTPTRTSTSRGRPTSSRPPTRRWCSRTATASTTGWPTSSRRPTARVPSSTSRPACRSGCRARTAARRPREFDPHWWHDPRNAAHAVEAIRDALATANPDAADTYRANADAYLARLEATDRAVAACLDRVPAGQRKLVSDHDAFGYFAARYGIQVIGAVIPSQSTQAQPSAGDLADLADLVRSTGVKAVFPEESLSPDLARADRAGDGRARRPHALRRRPRCDRLARRDLPRHAARQRRRDGRRLQRRRRPLSGGGMTGVTLVEAHDLAVGLRRQAGAARAELQGAAGRAGRRAGPERRRQVDAVPGRAGPAGRRSPARSRWPGASACCPRPSARASTTR